jgi:hypothetical protein
MLKENLTRGDICDKCVNDTYDISRFIDLYFVASVTFEMSVSFLTTVTIAILMTCDMSDNNDSFQARDVCDIVYIVTLMTLWHT